MKKEELFNNIKEHSKYASKDLGQNYLINQNSCEEIANLIKPSSSLLEIGSGFGSISFFFNNKNKSITLDDVDLRSIQFLTEVFKDRPEIEIINKSFLKMEIKGYETIVGNLPYYITSKCLEKVLIEGESLKQGVFMVQKEFFERLVGNGKEYGPLFILFDTISTIKKSFIVNRNEFLPVPNVDSLVFEINIKNQKSTEWKKGFYYFVNKMFLHRRKTIFNNLSLYLKNKIAASTILKKTGLDNNLRPEQISTEKYIELFESVLK